MECRNMKLIKIKYGLLVLVLMALCIINPLFTTKVKASGGGSLPYIEMKVKTVKVGSSTQVLVECWASNLTSFEGAEIVFTYDKTVLQPSYISGNNINEELADIESIKYENRPGVVTPSTAESIAAQAAFDNASKNLLSNSFAFDSTYASTLGIDIFRYLATNGNSEAIQFVMSKKDYLSDVSATAPVLVGTFSFKQTEGTAIEAGLFNTKRIKVICDDNPSASDVTSYIREEANGEDCTDIIEFTYTKYGSISGTIETGYMKPDSNGNAVYTLCGNKRVASKKTATVYLYRASDVASINWDAGPRAYIAARKKIITYVSGVYGKAYIPDETATPLIQYAKKVKVADGDNGIFKIDNIEFGEYVVFVDKYNYADYIITNITIDSNNVDIDLGKISLIAGDLNKDGVFNTTGDRNPFILLIQLDKDVKAGNQDLQSLGLEFAYDLNDDGKAILAGDRNIFILETKCIDKQTIKKVVDYTTI